MECVNFRALCNIIKSLRGTTSALKTRSCLASTSTKREGHDSYQVCFTQQSWAVKKPKLTIHSTSSADDGPIFDPDEAARRLCQHWDGIFSARSTSIPNGRAELAPPELICNFRLDEFEERRKELLASKRESAPGPDGLPYGLYRSAGGIGAKFLFAAY